MTAVERETNERVAGTAVDRDAFAELARIHHRQLLAYGTSLTGNGDLARDLVQDAFAAAYQNLGRFEISRDFGAWMRGIIRNKWRDWVKRKKVAYLATEDLERLEAEHTSWQSLGEAGANDAFAALEDCLAGLTEPLREAVDAFYIQDQSGADAADLLGTSEASLRKRLERARAQLKLCLSNKSINDGGIQDA